MYHMSSLCIFKKKKSNYFLESSLGPPWTAMNNFCSSSNKVSTLIFSFDHSGALPLGSILFEQLWYHHYKDMVKNCTLWKCIKVLRTNDFTSRRTKTSSPQSAQNKKNGKFIDPWSLTIVFKVVPSKNMANAKIIQSPLNFDLWPWLAHSNITLSTGNHPIKQCHQNIVLVKSYVYKENAKKLAKVCWTLTFDPWQSWLHFNVTLSIWVTFLPNTITT